MLIVFKKRVSIKNIIQYIMYSMYYVYFYYNQIIFQKNIHNNTKR